MPSRKHQYVRMATGFISDGLRFTPTIRGTRNLMYHAISRPALDDTKGLYSLGVREFLEHLEVLTRYLSSGHLVPVPFGIAHPLGLHITFDDGYLDSFDAALTLADRGFYITIFVASSLVGSEDSFLAAHHVRHLASHKRIEIGSHGHNHVPLIELSDSELSTELTYSRLELSEICGKQVDSLSYPFGLNNERVRNAVQRAGFRRAATSRYGFHRVTTDPFRIPRLDIWSGDDRRTLESRLSGAWNVLGWTRR